MTPSDRIARADRANRAIAEFLGPAFNVVEAEYTARLTALAAEQPWEAERITKLAMAVKIARAVRGQIEAVVTDGRAAEADVSRAAQIERISTHKRRLLGL